jgi:hypothetical protein
MDSEVDVTSAWQTIRESIKISAKEGLGYYELRKHKPWLDEGFSRGSHLYKLKSKGPNAVTWDTPHRTVSPSIIIIII